MVRGPRLQPGGVAWLLAHECRLAFYDLGESRSGRAPARGMSAFGKSLIALMFISAHIGIWLLMRKMPVLTDAVPPALLMFAGAAMLMIFSMMLSLGLSRSVMALFERGDLDLLLSSPLSSKAIFVVKLAGISFSVGVWFFLLLTPVANAGLFLGQWYWLGIYPVLAGMSALAAALSMVLTLFLVKTIGVRKTRTAAQILGAVTGAALFLVSQLFGNLGKEVQGRVLQKVMPWFQAGGIFDIDSPVWLPARALFGSPSAILVFVLFSAAICWLTIQFTHGFFVRGVQQAAGNARKPLKTGALAGRQYAGNFSRSLRVTMMVKEWRLIARDPHLISQVLLQVLYIAPLFFLIFKSRSVLPGVAAGVVFLAGSLAGSLTWVIVAAEDAPDLLRASPVSSTQILTGKLMAVMLPIGSLMAPALIWMLLQQIGLGLLAMVCTASAMLSSALIQLWQSRPATRSQFKKRGQSQVLAGLYEAFCTMSWAACIYAGMLYPAWLGAPVATALLILAAAWVGRIERNN